MKPPWPCKRAALQRLLCTGIAILVCVQSSSYAQEFTKLDFAPREDGWDIEWLGPGMMRQMSYGDVKSYTVSIELEQPVYPTTPYKLSFYLMSGNHVLGGLSAEFDANSRTPSATTYVRRFEGEAVPGTPDTPYDQGFWLGCTKRGRVKGNGVKSVGHSVNLYLRMFGLSRFTDGKWHSWIYKESARRNSPEHNIRCFVHAG
jgi:hypothetical protein